MEKSAVHDRPIDLVHDHRRLEDNPTRILETERGTFSGPVVHLSLD